MYIYHRRHAEHVAEMRAAGVVLRDVRKVSKIVGVLAGAVERERERELLSTFSRGRGLTLVSVLRKRTPR